MAPSPTPALPALPALPDRAMMSSDELDWLVYSYLEESGYHHTSFSLLHESNLARPAHNDNDADEGEDHVKRNPVMDHVVPPGHLVRLLQKALLYLEAEARYRKDPPDAIPRIVGYSIPTTLPLPPLPKHVPPPTPPPTATADTTGDKGKRSSKPRLAPAGEPSAAAVAAAGELSSTTAATKKPKKKVVAVGETLTTAAAASAVPEAGPSRKAKTPAPSEAAPPPPPASTLTKQTMGRTNSGGGTGAGPSSVAAAPPSSSKGKERAVAETTTEMADADADVHMEDATSASAAHRPNGRRTSVSAGAEAPPTTTKRKEKSAAPAMTTTTTTGGTVGPAKREREKDDLRPPPAKKSAATLTGSASSGQETATTTTASGKRSASPSVPRKSKPTAPPAASSSIPTTSSDATSLPAASHPSSSSSAAAHPPTTASSSSAPSTSALAGSTTTSSSAPLPPPPPPPPPPPHHPPTTATTTTTSSAPNKFRITTTTKTVSTPVTVSSSHHHSHSQSQSGGSGSGSGSSGAGGGGGGGPPPISAAQLAADKRRRGSGEVGATTGGSGKEGDRFHKIKNEAGGGGANDGPPGHANGAKGKGGGGGGGGGGGPKSPTKPPSSPLKEFDMRGVREIGDDDPRVVRLKGHTVAKVQPCAFNSKVPSLLATGGGDSTCRIWDVPPFTPTDLKSSQAATTVTDHIVCKHQSAQRRCDITCVAWNPSGSLLATGSEDGIVRIWTPSGDLHLVLSMHQRQVCSLKWNPMGTMLLTSSLDQTVCLWEVSSGKVRQQYATHSDTVLDVDWNDDQTWASASMDKTVHLMSLSRTTPLHRFRGHRDEVNVVKFSPCGTLVASCSDDSTVRVWSLRNIPALARDMAAKPVKRGDESRRIDRDEEEGGAGGVFVLEGHESDVHQIAWHPDAGKPTASGPRLLASCSFDSTAKLWDADAGTCLYTFARASDYVYSIAFEPVSGRYVATGSNDGRLDIYRIEDRALVTEYKHSGPIYEITWHPHGQQIAVCGQSDIVGVVGFEPSKAA